MGHYIKAEELLGNDADKRRHGCSNGHLKAAVEGVHNVTQSAWHDLCTINSFQSANGGVQLTMRTSNVQTFLRFILGHI